MSAIITMAIVVRYGAAKGHKIDDRCSLDVAINRLWGAVGDCGRIELIGRLGMLAAAEMLSARAAKLESSTSIDGSYKAAVKQRENKREAYLLRNEAERLIEAAGVDPKTWEATR